MRVNFKRWFKKRTQSIVCPFSSAQPEIMQRKHKCWEVGKGGSFGLPKPTWFCLDWTWHSATGELNNYNRANLNWTNTIESDHNISKYINKTMLCAHDRSTRWTRFYFVRDTMAFSFGPSSSSSCHDLQIALCLCARPELEAWSPEREARSAGLQSRIEPNSPNKLPCKLEPAETIWTKQQNRLRQRLARISKMLPRDTSVRLFRPWKMCNTAQDAPKQNRLVGLPTLWRIVCLRFYWICQSATEWPRTICLSQTKSLTWAQVNASIIRFTWLVCEHCVGCEYATHNHHWHTPRRCNRNSNNGIILRRHHNHHRHRNSACRLQQVCIYSRRKRCSIIFHTSRSRETHLWALTRAVAALRLELLGIVMIVAPAISGAYTV